MSDTGPFIIPEPPVFPPDSYADETPPPPVIQVTTQELGRPTMAFAFPETYLDQFYRWVYWFHRDHLAPQDHAHTAAARATTELIKVGGIVQQLVNFAALIIGALIRPLVQAIDVARKALDPSVGVIAVDVLGELMGDEYTADQLAAGTDPASHQQRALVVGGILHDALTKEFAGPGDVTPIKGHDAARRFSGFLINFGTATGILAFLGGLVPMVHADEIREIGEEVAKNLGLGRLHRMAMQPLIRTLIQTPYQWWINQQFHPTQFRAGDVANPYTGAVMSHDQIVAALDLDGYSVDKINALIALHQKKLTEDDIDALYRWGAINEDTALAQIGALGYTEDNARLKLSAIEMRRGDLRIADFIHALEAEYVKGTIDDGELLQALTQLPVTSWERSLITATAAHKHAVQLKSKHLTLGEAEYAFENALIDLNELVDAIAALGYDDNSAQVLLDTTLFKTKKLNDALAAKRARQAAAAVKAAAAASAAAQKTPTS
jgi:hypothetical protein